MTYTKSKVYKKITGGLNVYYTASVNSVAADEPVTWANLDSSFTNTFTLSKSGAQFTLPNDGKTYILEASLCINAVSLAVGNTYATYQWYDITNSTYVGIKGHVAGAHNHNEGQSGGVTADEKAIFVTNQNNVYELRILTFNSITTIDYNGSPYYNSARCTIWRF